MTVLVGMVLKTELNSLQGLLLKLNFTFSLQTLLYHKGWQSTDSMKIILMHLASIVTHRPAILIGPE